MNGLSLTNRRSVIHNGSCCQRMIHKPGRAGRAV